MFSDSVALRLWCVCLLILIPANSDSSAQAGMPEGIHSGLVVINGQLLDGPYLVTAEGLDVTINGQVVGQVSVGTATKFPFEDSPTNAAIAQVERLLLQEGVLLKQDEAVLLLPGYSGQDAGSLLTYLIEILSGDRSESDILQSISDYDDPALYHMTTSRWSEIIALFKTKPELGQQIADYCGIVPIGEPLGLTCDTTNTTKANVSREGNITESVQYGINLLGMLAGVTALGSLLSLRPDTTRRWQELNSSVAGLKLVSRCGILILLLGLFDLVCTLMAVHTGMFRELNPVASQISNSPLMIIGFKASAMAIGVGLLWRLRQYSGAQTAAWWMCLVCTLVVFRWLTFHSMFIA